MLVKEFDWTQKRRFGNSLIIVVTEEEKERLEACAKSLPDIEAVTRLVKGLRRYTPYGEEEIEIFKGQTVYNTVIYEDKLDMYIELCIKLLCLIGRP